MTPQPPPLSPAPEYVYWVVVHDSLYGRHDRSFHSLSLAIDHANEIRARLGSDPNARVEIWRHTMQLEPY